MNNVLELLVSEEFIVVDVRTPAEFLEGHLAKSVNIPLNELQNRLMEFKSMKPAVLCCASGIRSNKATNFLKQFGIQCQDGGSWLTLQSKLNNKK